MTKKVTRSFLPMLLVLTLMISLPGMTALAEGAEYPVLPDGHPESLIPTIVTPEILPALEKGEVEAASALMIEVEQSGELPTLSWTAAASGGDGNYTYSFHAILPTIEDGETIYYSYGGQEGAGNSFSFTFQKNGAWELWVDVEDGNGLFNRKVVEINVELEGMDPLQLTITGPEAGSFTNATTWTASFTGGDGNYTYAFYLAEMDSDLEGSRTVTYTKGNTTGNSVSLSYQFLASGNYELQLWVKDGNGQGEALYKEVTSFDDSYPTVSAVCTDLVQQCRTAGNSSDYDIALWLHDWLTQNANYDYTYSHYSADGVLCGGTGVCDSYSKAYLFLLREAGIPAIRITNDGHAWNAVQLDGKWYNVDCTWDDPGEGGNENHIYCFLPDEVMDVDHKDHDSTVTCTSFDDNYYVRTGDAQDWADSIAETVTSLLQNGNYSYTVDFPTRYVIEGYVFSDRESAGTVLGDRASMALASEADYAYGDEPVELIFDSKPGDTGMTVQIDFNNKTLELPNDLVQVEASAFFDDTAVRAILVPESTETIADAAFRGMDGLWMIRIPNASTGIAEGAFDGNNPHLTIVAPTGSNAEQYAMKHSLKFEAVS